MSKEYTELPVSSCRKWMVFQGDTLTIMLQGEALLRDLLAIHVVAHLNEALCQNYRKMCNASAELTHQCNQVLNFTLPLSQHCQPHATRPGARAKIATCLSLEASCAGGQSVR